MRRPFTKRKCKHCQTFFAPDPRSAKRQRYCSKPACRQASKAASQRRWLHKPANCDYFTGPTHVERVRQWRKAHPGYWRRQGSRAPHALRDDLTLQEPKKQQLTDGLTPPAWDRLREPNGKFTLCTAHSMPSNNAKCLLSYRFAVAEHL